MFAKHNPAFYRLVLRSHLGSSWTASLPVVEFATTQDGQHAPITCMTLRVADQSELIGLLLDLHAHNLIVESLKHLDRAA
jgi:hypothetical protein